MALIMERISALTFGKVSGLLTGVAGSMCVLWVCWFENDVVTSLCGLVGGALGWLSGILIAPLNANEQRKFGELSKIISGFVTGYLLSKIDPLITALLAIDTKTGIAALAQRDVSVRLLVALASYLIAVLMVFCARAYWSPKPDRA